MLCVRRSTPFENGSPNRRQPSKKKKITNIYLSFFQVWSAWSVGKSRQVLHFFFSCLRGYKSGFDYFFLKINILFIYFLKRATNGLAFAGDNCCDVCFEQQLHTSWRCARGGFIACFGVLINQFSISFNRWQRKGQRKRFQVHSLIR